MTPRTAELRAPCREKFLPGLTVPLTMRAVGEAEAGSAGEQPARNNQPETHREDERGSGGQSVAPAQAAVSSLDRFPNASENSFLNHALLCREPSPNAQSLRGKFSFGAPTARTALEQVAVMEQAIEHGGYRSRIP